MAGNGLPLYPTTVVGSWPRPPYLLDALRLTQRAQSRHGEVGRAHEDGSQHASDCSTMRRGRNP